LLRRVAGEVYSRVHGWDPTILRISNWRWSPFHLVFCLDCGIACSLSMILNCGSHLEVVGGRCWQAFLWRECCAGDRRTCLNNGRHLLSCLFSFWCFALSTFVVKHCGGFFNGNRRGARLVKKKGFLFSCPQVVSCTQFSPAA
jgi:hypothetical protein